MGREMVEIEVGVKVGRGRGYDISNFWCLVHIRSKEEGRFTAWEGEAVGSRDFNMSTAT